MTDKRAGDYPADSDGDALRRVAALGADMSRPMLIDFAVACPDSRAAGAFAAEARRRGYSTELVFERDHAEDQDDLAATLDWTCYCSVMVVPTYEEVTARQADLDALASVHGCQTDGWGTEGNASG